MKNIILVVIAVLLLSGCSVSNTSSHVDSGSHNRVITADCGQAVVVGDGSCNATVEGILP